MAGTHRDVNINANAVARELHHMMSNNQLFMSPSCCIFPVPTILRRHNPKAYTPNAFSIGPFHHKKLSIWETTHKIKLEYLDHFVSRPWQNVPFNENNHMSRLWTITDVVTNVQEAARECYAGWQRFNDTEFVQVLVLDGCFLIELFRKKAYYNDHHELNNDPIFSTSCWLQYLYHDLILLENQIPWIVLEDLFEITRSDSDTESLVQLVIRFFGNMFSTRAPSIESIISNLGRESKHILDLMRNSLVMSSNVQANRTLSWQPMPSATSLRDAGIKFTSNDSSSNEQCNILDIQFKSGVLKIPSLFIQETTESLFRNIISLEQCCPNYNPIITSYAILMDNLINTNGDMEILTKSGVIKNWLNIDDATSFFNKLYNDTYIKENYYQPLTVQLNKYCKKSWPRWRMVLMNDYFRHPWALISVIAAAILLIFSFLQTLFTIIK